uniref:Uncharacterized protein n=1 Tax=Glossina austeni TaxID=7395 RepID=A0A1A9VG85_GLOAU
MRGGTAIAMTASRKTSKKTKDKEYQNDKSKEGKDNGNSSKMNVISRRPNLRHRPKQGQFNKISTLEIEVNALYEKSNISNIVINGLTEGLKNVREITTMFARSRGIKIDFQI